MRMCACSAVRVARAARALCRPRSSSASGRSRRAILRTSSVPSRAVSRSSSSCSRSSSGIARRETLDLEHHSGERLADLIVQLARDTPPLALLHHQCTVRAVTPLGLEPLEHLVERRRQRGDVWFAIHTCADSRGQRIVAAHRLGEFVERPKGGPQQQKREREHEQQPDP